MQTIDVCFDVFTFKRIEAIKKNNRVSLITCLVFF